MVDPIIITIIVAAGAVAVSVLGYIKHSSCCWNLFELQTKSKPTTPVSEKSILLNYTKNIQ